MWNKTKLWTILLALLFSTGIVCGVELNTNLTLRATCLDSYGNFCTSTTGLWTVILPNGTTLYNQSAGDGGSIGVSNFTIWFNTTGLWFVRTNFSGQNITHEYNIVVADSHADSLWSSVSMMGIYVLLAIIIFGLIYMAFQMSTEHSIIKWFLVLTSILLMILGVGIARWDNPSTSSVGNLLDTAFYTLIIVMTVVFIYAIIYTFYVTMINTGKMIPDPKSEGKFKFKKV